MWFNWSEYGGLTGLGVVKKNIRCRRSTIVVDMVVLKFDIVTQGACCSVYSTPLHTGLSIRRIANLQL